MTKEGLWEIPASMGAVNALRENRKLMTEKILLRAEHLALAREKASGRYGSRFDPAILRRDVEQALFDRAKDK